MDRKDVLRYIKNKVNRELDEVVGKREIAIPDVVTGEGHDALE